MSACGSDERAVEKHDSPATHVHVAFGDEGLAAQLAVEHGRLIVIARNAHHRHAERAEDATEMFVAARVVLHEIASHEHTIDGPLTRLRESERARQRGQRSHTTQRGSLVAEEMRIGELDEADAHFQYSA